MDRKENCLPAGTVLKNRYEIERVIGTGGFGITYRAIDRLLNCYAAVKEFFPQEWARRKPDGSGEVCFPKEDTQQETVRQCRKNFHREAGIMEAVKDVPYIARMQDNFLENGTEYLVLNLIRGKTLSEYVKKRGGKLPAAEVLSLLQNTFDTLSELHRAGIIHRDISPGNLMLSEDSILYLIDFGSASSFRGREDLKSEQVFRHKGLEPPEHSQPEKQGPWTDIFSLCATIVYLITGEGIAEEKTHRQLQPLPQLLMRSGLSARQQNALLKGLNPEISRRFSDVGQLHEALYGEALAAEELPEKWPVFYHARTFIGSKTLNQDNFTVDTVFYYKGEDCGQSGTLECRPGEIHVAAVCDGVGGSSYGELAAKAAVQAVIHFAEAYAGSDVRPDRLLEELLDQINEKILLFGEKIGRTATTLSLLLWRGSRYYAVNIGDSPIFLLRKRKLVRLSTAHTKAAFYLMRQQPPQRSDYNTLTRYLGKSGVKGSQMASFRYGKLQKGDTFLICTDGVSKQIREGRLKRYLSRKGTGAVSAIYRILEKQEKNDNCTAVVLKF